VTDGRFDYNSGVIGEIRLMETSDAMKVVLAPDKFAGTLSAPAAAAAMETGWRRVRPQDLLVTRPMSDGGPGFCDVLQRALPGSSARRVATTDPLGRPATATVVLDGSTAYVESADAVGLHLLGSAERDPERATSAGLAAVLAAALASGARRIVVGLGGSATNDGGRGLLEALDPVTVDRLRASDLVLACDVTNPLLGLNGATAVFAPQKGASPEAVARLEGRMQQWAAQLPGLAAVAQEPGAGAAGGLGAALLWLGGRRMPGAALVADAIGLPASLRDAALVVTGEGAYDVTSLRGKVAATVAAAAQVEAVPCAVLAGQVLVGAREAAAHGVDELLAVVDVAGSLAASVQAPQAWVAEAAARLASRWAGWP
jgi:glycerate kinase